MIQSKSDYLYYLECDKVALRKTTKRPRFSHDIIWKFERLLRKCEYYENCRRDILGRIYGKYLKFRYVRLSHKLGFSIAFNMIGPGLCIEHYGLVLINGRCGKNFRTIGGTVIGVTGDNMKPEIGDNVFLGFGAAIIGDTHIANGVAVGANSVVCKDIFTPNVSVGGVPAKIISEKGSEDYLIKATEIVDKYWTIR